MARYTNPSNLLALMVAVKDAYGHRCYFLYSVWFTGPGPQAWDHMLSFVLAKRSLARTVTRDALDNP